MPDPEDDRLPTRHAMRFLEPDVELDGDGAVRGSFPVGDAVRAPSGGPAMAAVGLFVDMLGGAWSMPAAGEGWPVTADLTLHLLPCPGAQRVDAEARALRRGRRTLVVAIDLRADGAPAGVATLSFALVARPESTRGIVLPTGGHRRAIRRADGEDPPATYLGGLGVEVVEPGVAVVELGPAVANVAGNLHGGVQVGLVDAAAADLGRSLGAERAETDDVHLTYLRPAARGPFRAEAAVVGPRRRGRLAASVRLLDGDGALCSYATASVVTP